MMGNNYFFKQILSVCMLLMLPLLSWAHDFKVDGIYYNINQDGKSVSVTYYGISPGVGTSITRDGTTIATEGYIGTKSVEIPSTVSFNSTVYAVTAIGDQAFFKNNSLETVIIPNTVTSIGNGAFTYCSKLKNVVIPSSVTTIGNVAFAYCFALDSLDIPEGVTNVGRGAFGNTSIRHIKISSSVVKIESFALGGCPNLESIVVDSGNQVYDSREGCNAIIDTKSNTLIAGCNGTVIPNSVTSIGTRAFFSCYGLKSISIPNSVENIGVYAFSGCSSLESVEISDKVVNIGNFAFANCPSIISMVVAAGNKVYDSREDCNGIIETASNTLVIGCKNTVIPKSVTSIDNDAFFGCSNLESIEIHSNVTSIGLRAFSGCSSLSSIVVASDNKVYDSREGCNAIIETDNNTLVIGCKNTTFPSTVQSIGFYAFSGCTSITSIEIPDGIMSIGDYAFRDCSKLNNVVIPSSVISIGGECFAGCSSLMSVTCMTSKVLNISNNIGQEGVFVKLPYGAKLYVPAQLVNNYKSAEGWKDFLVKPIEDKHMAMDEPVFEVAEQAPQFEGGMDNLMKFLGENLKYPAEALKKGTQGRVLVQFTVNVDGSLSDFTIIRSVDPLLDKEALRVTKLSSGKWIPGRKKGENVNLRYTLPISFNLQ